MSRAPLVAVAALVVTGVVAPTAPAQHAEAALTGPAQHAETATYRPLVMGHRGTRTGAPENTMPAFDYARRAGADAVEFDVYWTKPTKAQKSVMVVIHDPTLNRTTDCTGDVSAHTWSQLKRCDAGSWFGATWAGTRIPKFTTVLAWGKKHKLALNAEIKGNLTGARRDSSTSTITKTQAKQYLAAVKKEKMTSKVTMSADSHQVVRAIQARHTGIKTADIAFDPPESKTQIHSYGSVYEPDWHNVTPGNVATLHRLGMTVIIWPARDPDDYQQAYRTRADIILADDPAALKAWLAGPH